jgi:hypothetical protein
MRRLIVEKRPWRHVLYPGVISGFMLAIAASIYFLPLVPGVAVGVVFGAVGAWLAFKEVKRCNGVGIE